MDKVELNQQIEQQTIALQGKFYIQEMLTQLARHYKMERGKLMETLLARQVLSLRVMTNFKQEGATEADLVQVLKTLHLEEMKLADRIGQAINRANEAIEMASNIQAEGSRVLAKIRKENGV